MKETGNVYSYKLCNNGQLLFLIIDRQSASLPVHEEVQSMISWPSVSGGQNLLTCSRWESSQMLLVPGSTCGWPTHFSDWVLLATSICQQKRGKDFFECRILRIKDLLIRFVSQLWQWHHVCSHNTHCDLAAWGCVRGCSRESAVRSLREVWLRVNKLTGADNISRPSLWGSMETLCLMVYVSKGWPVLEIHFFLITKCGSSLIVNTVHSLFYFFCMLQQALMHISFSVEKTS